MFCRSLQAVINVISFAKNLICMKPHLFEQIFKSWNLNKRGSTVYGAVLPGVYCGVQYADVHDDNNVWNDCKLSFHNEWISLLLEK